MMQQLIKQQLDQSLQAVLAERQLSLEPKPEIQLERCRDPKHGDFASNLAMIVAKTAKMAPRQLAEQLVAALPASEHVAKVEVAGPGFINFTLADDAYLAVIPEIFQQKQQYGCCTLHQGERVHLEFVSANPTGPLHVGHGRSAAYSTCMANLLVAVGYDVHREYYVNDAGRQMRILALSTWLRYLQQQGETVAFPENAYQGDYIIDIAKAIQQQHAKDYYHSATAVAERLAQSQHKADDKEAAIDAYIEVARQLLGEDAFASIQQYTLEAILADIRQDLDEFNVTYDDWFYESSLVKLGLIEQGVDLLKAQGHVYERDGAIWFRATSFGDEKDRVLIRENGQPTYFASDVAYHLHKYQQRYDHVIDVFGADHHGYIARIRAFLQGLGEDPGKLNILLVQFVSLFRGKEKISMSTRSGSFVTLRELRQEVGNDAARYFYIQRKVEQHLDFDLELAKSQSNENPVYYIQYAHARICSVWRQLAASTWEWQPSDALPHLTLLNSDGEKAILRELARYPELIVQAAHQYAPHMLAHYLHSLAQLFHSYYNSVKFIADEAPQRNARLGLIAAIQQILINGLDVLGISAPSEM